MLDEIVHLRERLDAAPHLRRMGRLSCETVLLKVDETEHHLIFDRGRLAEVRPGPSKKTPYRFALVTDAEALHRFWRPVPEPGFHDLFGLVKIGRAEILGDILCLVRNLRFIRELLALPRGAA